MPTIDIEQVAASDRRATARRRATAWSLALIVAAAWLLQGALHLAFHAGHLDGLGTVDRFGLLLSLATVPALASVALWSNRNAQP